MESVGTSSPWDPPVLKDEIRQSVNLMVRYGRGSLPARRQVRVPSLMWEPLAQALNKFGLALLIFMAKLKSLMLTLPDPLPPPSAEEPELFSPHDQLSR